MILCGPAVLDRDQVHQLRTLHAARRNAAQLVRMLEPTTPGERVDILAAARQLSRECDTAIRAFWKQVQP